MGKINIRTKIDNLLRWEGGQRLFNFAYSIGAAIVICGALFTILHVRGGVALLCIGMGTEVLMFVITAFDRPPREYTGGNYPVEVSQRVADSGNLIAAQSSPSLSEADSQSIAENIRKMSVAAEQMAAIARELELLRRTTETLNEVSTVVLDSYRAITENSASISENTRGYVEKMNDLNRNLGGLNTIYEVQLKSVSSQIDSIERVNRGIKDIRDMYEKSAAQSARYCEETEKMARYMQQLNRMYEKTLDTMTVNIARQVPVD